MIHTNLMIILIILSPLRYLKISLLNNLKRVNNGLFENNKNMIKPNFNCTSFFNSIKYYSF